MDIPKNEINNKNIGMLLSPKFENQLFRESMGGNAGEMHAGVNAHYNSLGEITRFSNYPSDMEKGEKWVAFRVDVEYLNYPRNLFEKVLYKLQKRKDRWLIDGVYFEDKNENEDVKSVIENPADYVNKLSKKERRDYKK
jgi:hypothetical protein